MKKLLLVAGMTIGAAFIARPAAAGECDALVAMLEACDAANPFATMTCGGSGCSVEDACQSIHDNLENLHCDGY
jgi:hypothetical protein